MPRKGAAEPEQEAGVPLENGENYKDEAENLNRMLGAVLTYLTDDELEEMDIEFLLDDTEGLREWWNHYQQSNKKQIEEEIKKSLGALSLKELEKIREKIKEKQT